jgi:hypothetical protein
MKNKIFAFLLLAIFSLYVQPVHLPQSQQLSSKEMATIQGGTCDLAVEGLLIAAMMATLASGQWWLFGAAFAAYLDYLHTCDGPQSGGGGNGGGGGCCPNGGNSTEMGACQQEGGVVVGNSSCGGNNICCEY